MATGDYWPAGASRFVVGLNIALIVVIVACAYVVFGSALLAWRRKRSSFEGEGQATA
jgi:hypothetical protein